MLHEIPVDRYGAAGRWMARAVEACVHCGFCLPACPTYRVMGEEMDSPRGRIFLMKEVLEGRLEPQEAAPFVDRCLGCLSCVSACPSGVAYGELLAPYREYAASRVRRWWPDRAVRWVLMETLPYPSRLRVALQLGRWVQPAARYLPAWLRPVVELVPRAVPRPRPVVPWVAPEGPRRARAAVLAGCVQSVLYPEIHEATVRVLARNGVEVVVPPGQGCCGALAMHVGEGDRARRLARRNLRAFPEDVDAVVTDAAGCGSAMKEYRLLFAGRPEEEQAGRLAARVRDVAEFLDGLGVVAPPPLPARTRAVYHDACHLLHAQGVREPPRRLLAAVGNLEVVEPQDAELCCGSAGTYNLEHPEVAAELGRRKVQALLATEPEVVVTGNVGCMVQLKAHLQAAGRPVPVLHTVQVLDLAYQGRGLPRLA
ncbi:MAG: glycolate oxidase subunit GlcF [Armatimonadota bacterium]|nr:glycolate oxidase subunit GlcF [Armatimonadota bacterium]MDW8154980.1 glycolate oxidase subunit GlcF [Armatimonadota bacterium]